MLNNKILITGGAGFIGSHLTEYFIEKGFNVVAFDRYNSNNDWGWLENSKYKSDIQVILGDIRDYDSVSKAMRDCRAVFHLAALIGIPYSYISPLAYIRTNIEGTYNVLEAAKNLNLEQVLITSTSETYGTAQYVPIDEKHPLVGQSPYSASKIAADMGGAGFVFAGENDADIMHNSAMINLNMVEASVKSGVKKIFYSSSACMYPERNQMNPDNPNCKEDSAYPAEPDSEYGWEKLFSERFYLAANRNYGIDIRIALFHNIFGPEGSWNDGREKAPAAFCRKVAETPDGGVIEMWGDGEQTRSFLYIDECLEGVRRLMQSDFKGPVNIGSEEMVSINQLAEMAMEIAGRKLTIKHIPGPLGVRGRNSDNRLIKEKLDWEPNMLLKDGMEITYGWIATQVGIKSLRIV